MSGLLCKAGIKATVASVVLLGTVLNAAAKDNCESYAKLTLQQAKQNVDRRCNFRGARWSLDVNQHRAWCREVGPSGWRAELKLRNEMLSDCNG